MSGVNDRTELICNCFRLALDGNGERMGSIAELNIFHNFLEAYPECRGALLRTGLEWVGNGVIDNVWRHRYQDVFDKFEQEMKNVRGKF